MPDASSGFGWLSAALRRRWAAAFPQRGSRDRLEAAYVSSGQKQVFVGHDGLLVREGFAMTGVPQNTRAPIWWMGLSSVDLAGFNQRARKRPGPEGE